MNIVLERKYKKNDYTIGILYINGQRFSDTVEDKDRGLSNTMTEAEVISKKVYGETAIPTGTYEIRLNYSPKFATRVWGRKYNGKVPQILNVKGYSGIRIHPANKASELLGCIAPGRNTVKGQVTQSIATYYKLMDEYLLPSEERGEIITITIK